MKISLPWYHKLLRPYFNWRADVREKRAAQTMRLLGYFVFETALDDRGRELDKFIWVYAAFKNQRGQRKLVRVSGKPPWWAKPEEHGYWPNLMAWKMGDDSREFSLRTAPFMTAPRVTQ